jgi:hypothetical protein
MIAAIPSSAVMMIRVTRAVIALSQFGEHRVGPLKSYGSFRLGDYTGCQQAFSLMEHPASIQPYGALSELMIHLGLERPNRIASQRA